MQWFLLLAICLVDLGYGINRYILIPLQDQLIEYYNINSVDYNLLQSIYSWPNAITLLFCGIIIDRIGLNRTMFVSWTITMLGCVLVTISCIYTFRNYILLCIGRIIIGISNEFINVALKVYIVNKFDKTEYGFAMAAYIAFQGVAGAVNNIFIFQIYLLFNSLQFALTTPLIIYPILSFPFFIINIQNSYCQPMLTSIKKTKTSNENESSNLITPTTVKPKTKIPRRQTVNLSLSTLKQFNLMYWILVCIGSLFSINYGTFGNIRISFLHHMYGYSYSFSTMIDVVYNIVVIILCPISGIITDNFGIKGILMLLAITILGIAHYLYGWIHINIIITVFTLVLNGAAVGIFFPVWFAAIPILVSKKIIGTAYGISESLRFASMGIGFVIVGLLTQKIDGDEKYIHVQYFQISVTIVTFIIMYVLLRLDAKNNHKLYKATQTIMDLDSIENENDLADRTEMELDCTSLKHQTI